MNSLSNLLLLIFFLSSNFRKSTEKDVVKEVKAESALLYAAAINPNKINTNCNS